MTIKTKHSFGDIVYIKHDPEQKGYEVVGIKANPGSILIELDYLGDIIEVYEFQISGDKDVLKSLTSIDKNDD
jgi:hypothetical protein